MLGRRVIVSIIGISLLIAVLFLGKTVFAVAVSLIGIACLIEFYGLFRKSDIPLNPLPGVILGASVPIVALYFGRIGMTTWVVAAAALLLIWQLASSRLGLKGTALTLLGVIYVGFFISHLVLIDMMDEGEKFVIFTFVAVWIADTAAYFVGGLAGKTPLTKRISPNKTVEGLIGALTINAVIFAFLVWMPFLSLPQRVVFALAVTVAAALGDLVESAAKRETGVKDSGNLIPGHGGFLDRFDSMLFAGAASFYLINIFVG